MGYNAGARPTIGFLSTWSVYEGTTIDDYTHALLKGVCAAAAEKDCNLLIGCGIALPGSPRASRTVWAVPGSGMDFVPVGPWNTDGLIIIPDDLSSAQFDYVQDLIRSGYPIILTTTEKPGPLVAVDNAGGIRQAFEHLVEHGHRRIAFIAGKQGRGGDSAERLAAYRAALQEAGTEADERLIAFGEHRREDGRKAMQQILDSGAPFTGLIASNDLSCLGAMEVLKAFGKRIPEDVGVIGFDDIFEAHSHIPALTTVRHPTFRLGYQAVVSVLEAIRGKSVEETGIRVATQLIIRQSCGCRPEEAQGSLLPATSTSPANEKLRTTLAHLMAEAVFTEMRHSRREEIELLCEDFLSDFLSSLSQADTVGFDANLEKFFDWEESHAEDVYAWNAAFTILRAGLSNLLKEEPAGNIDFANALIDRARLLIADITHRQEADALLRHMEMANRLGLMTSQLLAALDLTDTAGILEQHLPQLGIQHALAALYSAREEDPFSQCTVLLVAGLPHNEAGLQFLTREFPPAGLYPADQPYQLALLPLTIDDRMNGFVALSAANLEACAAIVHNLASALRTSQLYRDAIENRQVAEEANRLKSRFLSLVSHELRTPLSLIVGLSEMVLREKSASPETARRDIEQINTSAQHLARLIGDVLDLASSEAGQLRILREPLDLTRVLEVAFKIGEQMAREKGLAWRSQLPPKGTWVIGDRTRLRQVVLNLISNAVKFTQAGEIAVKTEVSDHEAVISVHDTGMGIPPNELEIIFQEFYRSERTIKSGYGGLGLGLAISKQLVEQHGGRIGVRSPGDLGSGSTFFFTLPLSLTQGFSPALVSPLAQRGKSVVILVDRTDPAEKVCTYLSQQGFDLRVHHVDEEMDWLAAVVALPPAAFILGNNLAVREGWALMNLLKRHPSTEHIPVLAYSLDPDYNHGELLELNYLHKPLKAAQLIKELAKVDEAPEERGNKTVLIVDDDSNILDMHSRLVNQLGYHTLLARNGREALEVIEQHRPDLILLDLIMPVMDGFTVLEALRTRDATRNIPVIVLTARILSEADLMRCNQGVAAILSKGLFSTTETLHQIETALAHQHALGGATQLLVRQAMAFIHQHYSETINREDIAAHISISVDYLTDCFRQEMNLTPMMYLRRYRIRQARELLETTDLSILQVALQVGFLESAHFIRTFQREVGMTPRAYRRTARG